MRRGFDTAYGSASVLLVPLQAPLGVQAVALVEDQMMVVLAPSVMLAGDALI